MTKTKPELIEELAAIEHERWSDWQKYVHSKCVPNYRTDAPCIPLALYDRWARQIITPYAELSEEEKQSDRDQVMRYWPLIVETFTRWILVQPHIYGFQGRLSIVERFRKDWK